MGGIRRNWPRLKSMAEFPEIVRHLPVFMRITFLLFPIIQVVQGQNLSSGIENWVAHYASGASRALIESDMTGLSFTSS